MPEGKKNPESLNAFSKREMATMNIFLKAKAARTAVTLEEYIETRLLQGASKAVLKADLLKDLEEGGRIFGEFRSAVRTTANGAVNRLRDGASFSVFGVDRKYRWAAVLVNTCPDCLERHGKVQTWDDWEAEGLPRTGATVCKENCKCMLIPASDTVLEPIKRQK